MDSAYYWRICSSNTTSLNRELHEGLVLGLLLFSTSFCGVCANDHIQIYFSDTAGSELDFESILCRFSKQGLENQNCRCRCWKSESILHSSPRYEIQEEGDQVLNPFCNEKLSRV